MGLFEHYPAEPSAILETADRLLASAGRLDALTGSVTSEHRVALAGVDGVLEFPIATAPNATLSNIGSLQLTARYASGCLVCWADGVGAYNTGIDRLNARWEAMAATLASAAQADKVDVQLGAIEPDDAEARMDGLLADQAALLAELRRERHRLEAALDGRAAEVGRMLDAGPNTDALGYLTANGFLPLPDPVDNLAYQHALDLAGDDPRGLSADEVAAWWARLSLVEQRAVMMADPHALGNLDGLPAATRDQANRLLLTEDLTRLEALEALGLLDEEDTRALDNIRAIQLSLDEVANVTGRPGQLYAYDPWAFDGDGKAAVTVGDIDTADHVAFLVSGLGTSVLSTTITRATYVYQASQDRTSDKVAVVNWIGYDAPNGGDVIGVVNRDMAESGAGELADDIAGFLASRGADDPHVTVIGNSYGSTTSAISADEYGLAADDLILTGSPGAGDADTAADLTTGPDHTWVGSASHDLVTALGSNGGTDVIDEAGVPGLVEGMGNDPADEDFDAQRFTAEHPDRNSSQFDLHFGDLGASSLGGWDIEDHQRYYDEGTESLDNITRIIVGDYDEVVHAEHRYDPLVDVDTGVDVDAACAGTGPLQVCIPTDVDVDRPDVDVMMQDPERDRTPEPLHN